MDFVKKSIDKKTLQPADNILIHEGQLFIQWLDDYIGNKLLGSISHQLDFKTYAVSLIDKGNNISVYDIKKLVNDLFILIQYDTPYAKVVFDNAEIEVNNSISTIEGLLTESRPDLQKVKWYKDKAISHFKTKPLIVEQLQSIFSWFDKAKIHLPKLFKEFEDHFQENIINALQDSTKFLTKHVAIWYNIEIDFDRLFSLKASEDKKDQFNSDKHEMIIEQSKIETKVDAFKEATLKGEQKGKLKTLLKLDINKLKRYFKSKDEEPELKEDFSLLNKKRYLKQLDKEQKWGKSELEKFEFIKKHVKTNPDNKYDQICNDLELAGENIDLGDESDYSAWSHM